MCAILTHIDASTPPRWDMSQPRADAGAAASHACVAMKNVVAAEMNSRCAWSSDPCSEVSWEQSQCTTAAWQGAPVASGCLPGSRLT